MICRKCGFDAGDLTSCPICGEILIDDEKVAANEARKKHSHVKSWDQEDTLDPEKTEGANTTDSSEKDAPKKDNKLNEIKEKLKKAPKKDGKEKPKKAPEEDSKKKEKPKKEPKEDGEKKEKKPLKINKNVIIAAVAIFVLVVAGVVVAVIGFGSSNGKNGGGIFPIQEERLYKTVSKHIQSSGTVENDVTYLKIDDTSCLYLNAEGKVGVEFKNTVYTYKLQFEDDFASATLEVDSVILSTTLSTIYNVKMAEFNAENGDDSLEYISGNMLVGITSSGYESAEQCLKTFVSYVSANVKQITYSDIGFTTYS